MGLSDTKLKSMLKGHSDTTPKKIADRDGLIALWRNTGKVSFVYRYRFLGKAQNVTLGTYTGTEFGVSLAQARKKADQCRAWLEQGRNPSIELKTIKQERQTPVTVQDALVYWLENYKNGKLVNASKYYQQFNKWIFPRIGYMPLVDCDTQHWLTVFDEYKKKAPVAAGYCFQRCKQALKYCRVRKYAISNALDDLKASDVGEKQKKRDRVLESTEIGDVWRWAKEYSPFGYYGKLFYLVCVYGCRTCEIRLSNIDEWDLESRVWVVPVEHSKNREKILRPIPDYIHNFLNELIQDAKQNKSDLLLTELKRPEAVSQYGRMMWKKFNHSKAWTLHDLRRTFATDMVDRGVNYFVMEKSLGHTLKGAIAHYVHSKLMKKQLKSYKKWLEKLDKCEKRIEKD